MIIISLVKNRIGVATMRRASFFLLMGLIAVLPENLEAQSHRGRAYRMGFSLMAPRLEAPLIERGFKLWSQYADAAIHGPDFPWQRLLNGEPASQIVKQEVEKIVNMFRAKDLKVVLTVDPLNGFNRSQEAAQLKALGRSIRERQVQELYVSFVRELAKLKPDYLGLAMEVNLFKRHNKDLQTYSALVEMVNTAARIIRKENPKLPLYVSVQADEAWGRLTFGAPEMYRGIQDVLTDYPFMSVLGLSSYPAIGWHSPGEIPLNYFSRLVAGHRLPVIFVEGGWGSSDTWAYKSSPRIQALWVKKLFALLDKARARFVAPLLFADIDPSILSKLSAEDRHTLELFVNMGLSRSDFRPKPALREWQRAFERGYRQP